MGHRIKQEWFTSVNLKEINPLDNANCKNIVVRCPEGNEISEPMGGKGKLEKLSDSQLLNIVSFHGLGQIHLLFQTDYS